MKEEKVLAEVQKSLASFEWDDNELEFFGQAKDEESSKETTDPEKEKEEKEKEEEKKEDRKEEDEEEEKKEEDKSPEPFSEITDETKSEEKKSEEDDFFKTLAVGLKDKGVFSFTDIPDKNIDENQFVKLYEDEVEARVQDTFEGFFEELDDDGKEFLKYKKDGGSTEEFFRMKKDVSEYPEGDITDENFQKRLLKFYYNNIEKLDVDDIDERMEWLEEGDKIEKYAKKYNNKIQQIKKDKQKRFTEHQKELADDEEDKKLQFQDDIKNTLDSTDSIKDFPITRKDKSELLAFITKPVIKVGKNRYITGLQKELRELSKDNKKLILLAKLLKSDFDMSAVEKKERTKQTRELKSDLQRAKSNKKPATSSSSGKRSLSEFFN